MTSLVWNPLTLPILRLQNTLFLFYFLITFNYHENGLMDPTTCRFQKQIIMN